VDVMLAVFAIRVLGGRVSAKVHYAGGAATIGRSE